MRWREARALHLVVDGRLHDCRYCYIKVLRERELERRWKERNEEEEDDDDGDDDDEEKEDDEEEKEEEKK